MHRMAQAKISARVVSEDVVTVRLVVEVREGTSATTHEVTIGRDLLARLSPGESAAEFARRSFVFLLEREPKESILPRFDVSVIRRYFPEYERLIAPRAPPALS